MVKKLFGPLAERYKARSGGYTRVLKAGYRYGDSAPIAVIELVDRDESVKGKEDKERHEAMKEQQAGAGGCPKSTREINGRWSRRRRRSRPASPAPSRVHSPPAIPACRRSRSRRIARALVADTQVHARQLPPHCLQQLARKPRACRRRLSASIFRLFGDRRRTTMSLSKASHGSGAR